MLAQHRTGTDASESGSMRVPPYHSSNAADAEFYHVYGDCPGGRQIPFANRRSGTNRSLLCQRCAANLQPLQDWPKFW